MRAEQTNAARAWPWPSRIHTMTGACQLVVACSVGALPDGVGGCMELVMFVADC